MEFKLLAEIESIIRKELAYILSAWWNADALPARASLRLPS
jgi:hypothetical protein